MTQAAPRTDTVVAGIATGATLCLASAMTVVAIATVVVMLSGLADEALPAGGRVVVRDEDESFAACGR